MSYVELSEEHRLFQKTVRDFVDEVIKPRAKEIDEAGEFPWWCIEELRKMGLMGVPYGEEERYYHTIIQRHEAQPTRAPADAG